ncbi:MAG: hypothetical protein ABIT71_26765 [Vicinamibacteraceae bacterium]
MATLQASLRTVRALGGYSKREVTIGSERETGRELGADAARAPSAAARRDLFCYLEACGRTDLGTTNL